jgi:hypothetical protein
VARIPFLVEKTEGKRPLEKPSIIGRIILKILLKK